MFGTWGCNRYYRFIGRYYIIESDFMDDKRVLYKEDLVSEVSRITDFTKKDVRIVVNCLWDVMEYHLFCKNDIRYESLELGVKKFKRKACRNPKTGETITNLEKDKPYVSFNTGFRRRWDGYTRYDENKWMEVVRKKYGNEET